MNGTITARYGRKCLEFRNKIDKLEHDPEEQSIVEHEFMTYQMDCIPFLEEMTGTHVNANRTKVDLSTVFGYTVTEDMELFNKYMKEVEGIVVSKPSTTVSYITKCTQCDSTDIYRERDTSTVCKDCGIVLSGCVIDDKPSYKDKDRLNVCPTTFTYKQLNHFNEWIDSLEAAGKTDVPNEVLDQVRGELKKQRYTDPNKITAVVIRQILKKLRHNSYYDCIPMIISNVVGRKPLVIPYEMRMKLKEMFREVQKIYKQHAPKHRSNFFSYPYILYKFCELIEADYVLPYLSLLKSTEKLYQQDQVFKSICKELKWEFIKTI